MVVNPKRNASPGNPIQTLFEKSKGIRLAFISIKAQKVLGGGCTGTEEC